MRYIHSFMWGLLASCPLTAGAQMWYQSATIGGDTARSNDNFGLPVALDGGLMLVGAPLHNGHGSDSGGAFLFQLSGTVWTRIDDLLPHDAQAYDKFGRSVALTEGTALIGAPFDDDQGDDSGTAYVFRNSGGGWSEVTKLLASDGAADDYFGTSVALSGDIAVIGAPYDDDLGTTSGSAYVFREGSGEWRMVAKLTAGDGTAGDQFGFAVAVCGDMAIVGAPGADGQHLYSGAAYVFRAVGDDWTEEAKLVADDGSDGDGLGWSVALVDETTVIGAWRDDVVYEDAGSAYVFRRVAGQWIQLDKLVADDSKAGDNLGSSVAIDQDTIVVGAFAWRDGIPIDNLGAAYVFAQTDDHWDQSVKLVPTEQEVFDWFGLSVAKSGEVVAVGACLRDLRGPNSGAVFVYSSCRVDLDANGTVDTLDYLLFLAAWAQGDELADWDSNGTVNTLDFLAYLGAWTAGC